MARKVVIGKKTKSVINTQAKTVGTTAVQLAPSTRPLEAGVQIVCPTTNTGICYVAVRSNVTDGDTDATDGYPLNASDSLFLPVSSESEIYVISDTAAQKVFWMSY